MLQRGDGADLLFGGGEDDAPRCSAAACCCPHGRAHAERRRRRVTAGGGDANAWAFVRCSLCGTNPQHLRCAGFERLLETSFVCAGCT